MPLRQLPLGAPFAFIRLRSLGDCVLTTPAIHLLHRARPDLRLAVVVEPRFAPIFEENPDLTAILPPTYSAILRFHPKLCLNLHGGTRSMLLTAASLAPLRAGFAHHSGAALYNLPIPRAQQILGVERTVHTAEHLASAVFHLGVPVSEIPRARLFAPPPPPAQAPYAILHPASAAAYKTWPPSGFLALAEHIHRSRGLEPIFIGSGSDDLSPFSAHRTVAGAPLREVMSLIAGASLFAGNDSGPAHIAAAFSVPLLVLYGRPAHESIWAPWQAPAAQTLSSPRGIQAITAAAAIQAVDQLP